MKMEMLPELREIKTVDEMSTDRGVLETSSHLKHLLITEKAMEIMGTECASTQLANNNWRESNINIFIAGLTENLFGSGAAAIFVVEAVTEAAVWTNTEAANVLVENKWKKPVEVRLTLLLETCLEVGGEIMDVEAKHSDIANLLLYLGVGDELTAGAILRHLTERQGWRRAVRPSCRRVNMRKLCRATQLMTYKMSFIKHTLKMFTSVNELSSEAERSVKEEKKSEAVKPVQVVKKSGAEKPIQEEKKSDKKLIELSNHRWVSLPANGTPAWSHTAAGLQTSCYYFTIQLVSRNLSPGCHHGEEPVLISKQRRHEIPARSLHGGQGSKHGATCEAWSGNAASVGVAGTIQFVMTKYINNYNHKNKYTWRRCCHQHNPEME